jgi:hypothetical protein
LRVRAEVGVDIDRIGAIAGHRAAARREATVLSNQPAGEYDPLPVVATNCRAQRPAACLWDDVVWDEV